MGEGEGVREGEGEGKRKQGEEGKALKEQQAELSAHTYCLTVWHTPSTGRHMSVYVCVR